MTAPSLPTREQVQGWYEDWVRGITGSEDANVRIYIARRAYSFGLEAGRALGVAEERERCVAICDKEVDECRRNSLANDLDVASFIGCMIRLGTKPPSGEHPNDPPEGA